MSLGAEIGRILQQYTNSPAQQAAAGHVEDDYEQVAQSADPQDLRDGLSEAFRSDQTPPFSNMVGQLFDQAEPGQRTGMLNHMLGGIGPSVIGSLLGGGGGGMLSNILAGLGGGQRKQLTEEEASQISPEQVQELAQQAERENPGIVDHMSNFYANNPTLVKSLGGAALAIVLGKMASKNRS